MLLDFKDFIIWSCEKMKLKKIIQGINATLKEVYSKPFYLFLTVLIALILISINILVFNKALFFSFPGWNIALHVFIGTFSAISSLALVTLLLSSFFAGVFISLLVYHVKILKKMNNSVSGSGGFLLVMLSPACPSCGVGLISVMGFGGMFAGLPLGGFEISFAGILLLIVAIASISIKISQKVCK